MEVSEQLTSVFTGTVTSTYYNIALQIFCKLVTFALNGLILRYISKDLLGVINVRLLLLHTTILFLCREGIRRACSGNLQKGDWKQTVNLIWLGTASSLAVSFGLSLVWLYAMETPLEPYYGWGVFAYAISATVDMLAEPVYITAQELAFVKLRVMAKFISLAIQASLNAIFVIFTPQFGILIFALNQFFGAAVYSSVFYIYFWKHLQKTNKLSDQLPVFSLRDFLPSLNKNKNENENKNKNKNKSENENENENKNKINHENKNKTENKIENKTENKTENKIENKTENKTENEIENENNVFLPKRLKFLAWSFTKQSLMKQILTEGERYIMSGLQMLTFAEQGVYDVINNLGSLVARLVFQQVEENAYVFFSKVLPRERDQNIKNKKNDSEAFGAKMLEVYLKTITAFSLIIVIFGYFYSDVLLSIYGGRGLTTGDAPLLMRAFWFYVLFLAVNGVTEAFVFSAMRKEEVDSYNRKLVGFSLVFLTSSFFLVKFLGSVGFIVANSLNMTLRIFHSFFFIKNYYKNSNFNPLRGIFVNKKFFLVCFFVAIFLPILRFFCNLETIFGNLVFLSVGGVLGLFVLFVLWKTETELIVFLRNLFRKKTAKLNTE